MTLNAKIEVFMDFFGNFGLQNSCQKRIVPKSTETDMKKLLQSF